MKRKRRTHARFKYHLESLGTRLSIEQTTLGEGTSSSTAKKRSYTREEKLKVVRGQESATLSATTSEARGTIRKFIRIVAGDSIRKSRC